MKNNFAQSVQHYLKVYYQFVSTRLAEASSFRLNFFLMVLLDLTFYMVTLSTVDFIYGHVEVIGPWNRNQLMFFISYMLAVDHLHMTFLSESFWVFSTDLKQGNFDFTLLRPISSIFIVFFRYFRPSSFLNIFTVWGVLYYFALKSSLALPSLILLPILVLLSFTLLALIEIIISTGMFWLTEGLGVNFFRMQMQEIGRWPDFIFSGLGKRFFRVAIPVLLIGSPSVRFLLDFKQAHLLIAQLVAIVLLRILLHYVWKTGIKAYDSASS